jgi:small conductance mechanosensitive channel
VPIFFHALISHRAVSAGTGGAVHALLVWLGVSESGANSAQSLLVGPFRIVVTVVVAFLAARLVPRLCRRLVRSLQLRTPLRRTTTRADSRATTVAGVLVSVFRTIVWVVASVSMLGVLGINLAPFVATATVIGAAVGFGAQSLVKDFLSGGLIVVEDQFGVGDSITIGDVTGTVEGVSLRTTRVRSFDGMVWYIPNGEIRKVGNSSEGYGQAVVDFEVPPGTDLTMAGRMAEEEVRGLAAEPGWRETMLEPPVLFGVQEQTHEAVTIRVAARTNAGDHLRTARAMRARILERLRQEGVAWASPPPDQRLPRMAAGQPDSRSGPPVERKV